MNGVLMRREKQNNDERKSMKQIGAEQRGVEWSGASKKIGRRGSGGRYYLLLSSVDRIQIQRRPLHHYSNLVAHVGTEE